MFNKLVEFYHNVRMKNYSTTMTTVHEGSNKEGSLTPRIVSLIKTSERGEALLLDDINFLMTTCLGLPGISTTTFSFIDSNGNGPVFSLESVNVVTKNNHTVDDLIFTMSEILLGGVMDLVISANNLKENLVEVNVKIDPKYLN